MYNSLGLCVHKISKIIDNLLSDIIIKVTYKNFQGN